jgi:hypothetical protein
MPASFESEPKRTELNTQDLPEIPAVQDMITWNEEKVLRWIQQRDPIILVEEDHLNNFEKADVVGRAFLASDYDFFHKICGLPVGIAAALQDLADDVKKEGKFIPRT